MSLRIQLLGPPQITLAGAPVDLPGHRPLALFAYLLLVRKPVRRESLIDLFFDGPDDPQAALRWTLSKVRKAIGGDYLLADRQQVAFNFESDFWLDVFAFEAGDRGLYKGDFLQGLHLRDALQFENWLLFERQRLREQHQAGLERQLRDHKSRGEYAEALITTQELVKLDNLREDWQFELIHAYARLGRRSAALETFEKYRQSLRKEMGADPSPELAALAEAVRGGQFEQPQLPALETGPAAPAIAPAENHPALAADPVARRPVSPGPAPALRPGRSPARWLVPGLAVVLLVALGWALTRRDRNLASTGGEPSPASGDASQAFAGTHVKILGAFPDEQEELFAASVLPLEQRSGIDVIFEDTSEDFELELEAHLQSEAAPDLIFIPQPGWLAKLAGQGKIIDLTTFLDRAYLQEQYPEIYLELVAEDSRILGIWQNFDVKSVVWYPRRAFEAKGYEVPETWEELLALSDRIVADGGTPWCIGIESAEFTGWAGTDWVEDILLRTAPPETYDAWVRHELPFASPEIRRAFEIMGQIWHNEAYVHGGTTSIPVESIFDSPDHLFEKEPGCYLHKQASFAQRFFPSGLVHGQDYDFFYLPPIDPEYGRPVLGSGNLFAMVTDRPEVREVMRYLTTVESIRPFVEHGGFLSPHKDTPLEWFPTPAELQFAQIILSADAYRFDASDMMPDQVGLRAFYQGIVDWVEGADLEEVLQEIDRSWPE